MVFLQFHDLAGKILPQIENGAPSEIGKLHFIGYIFTHFIIFVDLFCFRQSNLIRRVFVIVVFHHNAVPPDLKVPLVDVYDDIKILVASKLADQNTPESLFKNAHHRCPVNILQLLEF